MSLARMPEIVDITVNHLRSIDKIDNDLLLKVIGAEYP
jgi:hypothetical protein